jgi:PEGA domain
MLGKLAASALSISLSTVILLAQETTPTPQDKPKNSQQESTSQQTPSAAASVPTQPLAGFGIEDGTPIKLRLTRNLSSGTDKKGDTVDFEVLEDVSVHEVIVVPRGGVAWATITEAQAKRRMGRGGKLDVNIDTLRLKDGEKIPLRAVKENKGGGHVGAMTGAMVATGIVFFPAAPLFLFMHGKDIDIPKGTEITAYVAGNIPLEKSKFDLSAQAGTTSQAAALTSSQTGISVTSVPPGADVEVDGKFIGNTPSSMNLASGDHAIKVTKKGYKTWERNLTASGGTVNLNAELEEEK